LGDDAAGVAFDDLGARWRTEEDMMGWIMVEVGLERWIEE
jgi:hypothetical protein